MTAEQLCAVLYFRVSTEDQGRHGFSLAEQRRECIARGDAIAAQRGVPLAFTEFSDQASGEILERPGLEACREHLARHPTHLFICLDPDRFSRSLNLQLLVAEEIEKRGTDLVFVSHDYRRTPEGKLFFQLRGAIAEFEKAKILERTRRGRRGKLAAGGIPNYIATWGYVWNTVGKTLAVDETAAPWVRQIFVWYVDGWSYARIAAQLTAMGVRPARGERWHRSTIMRVVRNSTYVGRLMLNRWDCEGNGPLRFIARLKRSRPRTDRLRPPAQWVAVCVPPIVDEALWEQAQTAHSRRTRLMQRGVGLLSGLCWCGLCGGKIHYAGGAQKRYLRCRRRYPDEPGDACPWRDVAALGVERRVWEQVATCMLQAAAVLDVGPAAAPHDPRTEQLGLVERELERRRGEQRRTYHLFTRGLAPDGAERDLARLLDQVRTLEGQRTSLLAAPSPTTPIDDRMALQAEVDRRLGWLTLAQRQHLVRLLIERVTLWPDARVRCEFGWCGGSLLLQGRPTR